MTGTDRHAADVAYLASFFAATRCWEFATGETIRTKILREALWFTWQQPRLPRPLIRSKYRTTVPWTAAARAAYRLDGAFGALVIEHVEPAFLLIRPLLTTPHDLASFEQALYGSLNFAVVTAAEEQALKVAGVSHAIPDGDDLWIRYRLAGIPVEDLAPLAPSTEEGEAT